MEAFTGRDQGATNLTRTALEAVHPPLRSRRQPQHPPAVLYRADNWGLSLVPELPKESLVYRRVAAVKMPTTKNLLRRVRSRVEDLEGLGQQSANRTPSA
jgi:hypothetical protein